MTPESPGSAGTEAGTALPAGSRVDWCCTVSGSGPRAHLRGSHCASFMLGQPQGPSCQT